MDNKDLINKALDIMLQPAASDAEDKIVNDILKNLDDNEHIEFSKEHELSMKKIFRNQRRKILLKELYFYSKRIAVFFLVVIVISGVSIFSVSAWRIRFLNFVIDMKQTHTEINFSEDGGNDTYTSDEISFGYFPDGYKLEERDIGEKDIYLRFRNGENYFSFSIDRIAGLTFGIDTEGANVKRLTINGGEAIYSAKANANILVWHDDDYVYHIIGNIEEKEAVLIAENMKNNK